MIIFVLLINPIQKKMKNILSFLFILLLNANCLLSQKVDIDAYRFYISNAKLPINYVPEERRTYDVHVKGNWKNSDFKNSVFIPGWELTKDNPNLLLEVRIDPMVRGTSSTRTNVVEKKDKNGKVLSSTTYYYVTSTNTGVASFQIFGEKNEMPRVLSKKELEKKAKKEKEKKEKEKEASNPFLTNVDTKIVEGNQSVGGEKTLAYSYSLNKDYTYTTDESTSKYTAMQQYDSNANSAYQNHSNDYLNNILNNVNNYANQQYGYSPVKNYVKFLELDSEKHPEYTMYDNANKALKAIFAKMRYNIPIEEIENDLAPIIKYFNEVEQKYTKDEKHEKRLRAATLFNLATIFQYLDMHDKAIEIGNKMIALDLEKDDGEDIVDESTKIKKQLEFHHMKSRHIIPRNDAERAENEGNVDSEGETKP